MIALLIALADITINLPDDNTGITICSPHQCIDYMPSWSWRTTEKPPLRSTPIHCEMMADGKCIDTEHRAINGYCPPPYECSDSDTRPKDGDAKQGSTRE